MDWRIDFGFCFAGIFTANAQVWIGGSTSVFAGKNHAKFTIAPEVGYSFPNTKWTIAVGANYAMDYTKYTDIFNTVHKDYTHALILSPYVRYSICNIEKFAMFLDLTGDFDVLSDNFGLNMDSTSALPPLHLLSDCITTSKS